MKNKQVLIFTRNSILKKKFSKHKQTFSGGVLGADGLRMFNIYYIV